MALDPNFTGRDFRDLVSVAD